MIIQHPIFLGATRPTTLGWGSYGITYEAFFFSFFAAYLSFMLTGNPAWLFSFFPYAIVSWLIEKKEPRAFRFWRLWAMTRLFCFARFFWKTSTRDPLPRRRY
jgi:type IV secretory pathway VirB3-like protein